ncbi:unnamed protein product, partial [Rotaria socialis]
DGYDEIVQNVPSHLQRVFEQLLNTPHHIVTSRPYFNTLSRSVRVEIVGFTDGNISKYVEVFFNQLRDKFPNALFEGQKVLKFLRLNPRIWGIAHISVNLELICSIWSETDWSETTNLTMTTLYENMTVWLCRRYLARKSTSIQISKMELYEKCHPELTFLETLAFEGMTSNTIILRKELLQKVMHNIGCLSDIYSDALHIGILKSFDNGPTGSQIQLEKHHYFVHLSFQEFFAAWHLVRLLNSTTRNTAIQFIENHKYEKRLQLVFIFASGLLTQSENTQSIHTFWDTIFGDLHDLVGIRHMQLVTVCLDETQCDSAVPHRSQSISLLLNWFRFACNQNIFKLQEIIARTINSCSKIQNFPEIQIELACLLKTEAEQHKSHIATFIRKLNITDPHNQLLESLSLQLEHNDAAVRTNACGALGEIGEKASTSQVTDRLVGALGDQHDQVRRSAYSALEKIGEKAATSQVIDRLVVALGDQHDQVRQSACSALEKMCEKAATSQVIDRLLVALGDLVEGIRGTDLRSASTLLKLWSYALQWLSDSHARECDVMQKSNVYDGIDGMSLKIFQLVIYTHDWRWLSILVECCLMEEIAVMVIGDRVIMRFEWVAVETRIRNLELLSELCKAFDDFGLKVLDCHQQNSRKPWRERK